MNDNTKKSNINKSVVKKDNIVSVVKNGKQIQKLEESPYRVTVLDDDNTTTITIKKAPTKSPTTVKLASKPAPHKNKAKSVPAKKNSIPLIKKEVKKVFHDEIYDGKINTKDELIFRIATKENIAYDSARDIIDAIFGNIKKSLHIKEEVSIAGFGKFEITRSKKRDGINPSTGERIKISASNHVKFKAAKQLKDAVDPNHKKAVEIESYPMFTSKQEVPEYIEEEPEYVEEKFNEYVEDEYDEYDEDEYDDYVEEKPKQIEEAPEYIEETETSDIIEEIINDDRPVANNTENSVGLKQKLVNYVDASFASEDVIAQIEAITAPIVIKQLNKMNINASMNGDNDFNRIPNFDILTSSESVVVKKNIEQESISDFVDITKEQKVLANNLYSKKSIRGKKQKTRNIILIFLALLLVVLAVSFVAIKLINAFISGSNGLTINWWKAPDGSSISLSISLLSSGIANIIEWIANLLLIVVLPIIGLVFITYLAFFLAAFAKDTVKYNELANLESQQALKGIEVLTTSTSIISDADQSHNFSNDFSE